MSNHAELTFKDLQNDERYKRLERTLKMALLKNTESRTIENGNTGGWPSISSITGDNLDMSCAAMSSRSSRNGSEVIASSSTLRNLLHKKMSSDICNNVGTASGIQFLEKKDKDSLMMPPPRMPGLFSGQPKITELEKQCTPFAKMLPNQGRKKQAFAMSTPKNSEPSVTHSLKCVDEDPNACFEERNEYHGKNYLKDSDNGERNRTQERIFSRWRVLLNDKSQLIIKGTLECGKIARSKPVIRRLSATSVQSIFKHTYHLQGNLVDERNELPDYVSGKFYNGFPDDWENVYQVWRNFVSGGSRLSFRWPTAITDSDDDIKSGITELSCYPRFEKHTKSKSPRKRTRCSKPLSPIASTSTNKENEIAINQCACSHVKSPVPGNSLETSIKSIESWPLNTTQSRHTSECGDREHKNRSMHNITNPASLNSTCKNSGNSLTNIIQEDKLNIILNNLADKNCPLQYIQKIMEMLECMKYVISYQTESNNAETQISLNDEESCTRKPTNQLVEEKLDCGSIAQHSKNVFPENTTENQTVPAKLSQSRRDKSARRKLSKGDYDSTESENDCHEPRKRRSVHSRFQEKTRKSHKYQNSKSSSLITKIKCTGASLETEKVTDAHTNRDSQSELSLSENEFLDERNTKRSSRDKVIISSGKPRIMAHDVRGVINNHDSSVSFTEEEREENYKPRMKALRQANYDSSVSITEDERGETRSGLANVEKLNYSPKILQTQPVQPEIRRIETRDVLRSSSKCNNESNCVSIDSGIERTSSAHRLPVETPTIERSTSIDASNKKTRSSEGNFPHEQEISTDFSPSPNHQKIQNPIRSIVETASHKSVAADPSNGPEFHQIRNNVPLSPTKIKILKKKPVVVISSEPVHVDLRKYYRANIKNGIENCTNATSPPRHCQEQVENEESTDEAKNLPNKSKNSMKSVTERIKITDQILSSQSPKKGINIKPVDQKAETEEIKLTKNKSVSDVENLSLPKYGSEDKPKKLTRWVPVVICDDNNSKCHLVFEGKLLNEADHVENRKFTTDFVERRINAKLVRTVSNVHYLLVGDLFDNKKVVPKELLKECRSGCPSNINRFCEKWKVLSTDENRTPNAHDLHSTSVDCLGVPTSSRGRRILPPLNYWTGERIITKDNTAVYTPGTCKELSVTSSFDKSSEDNPADGKHASKKRTRGAGGTSKKDATNVSPPVANKSSVTRSSCRQELPKEKIMERRLARKMQYSSSGSEEDEPKVRTAPMKRKMKASDATTKGSTAPKRILRHTSKNTASPPSFEQSSSSPDSFKKPAVMEPKSKPSKRQKVHKDEAQTVAVAGSSKQLTMRKSSGVTCAFYRNVPWHNDDLSEDQLSTV
ncbi:uncharacterized protein [Venturia canescens]|uniref:uncharacterized protein isoform X2 n=1 Tax=Venturia canescens TaxID=32260 RepID=UPI001C9CCE69|nr:uncharacterized protein LOC122407542 isoform X2 [Venturia canescens]